MGGTTVLDAARAVGEAARTHADETERGRRLAQPVVAAFEASGLGGALAPRAIGGTAAAAGITALGEVAGVPVALRTRRTLAPALTPPSAGHTSRGAWATRCAAGAVGACARTAGACAGASGGTARAI